jgi:hypothetical protein
VALREFNEFVYGVRRLEIIQIELSFVGTVVETVGCQVCDFWIHVLFSISVSLRKTQQTESGVRVRLTSGSVKTTRP